MVHGAGVVHRDIKPANILLAEHERSEDTADLLTTGPLVKLADFGIARYAQDARLTATGTTLGTAMYLSPEQAAGAAVGPPTDVYALGLVLLESMTGVRPFSGTIVETISARLSSDPLVPAGLPAAWRSVLLAMTRRDVDERISAADAATALSALVDALHGEPATASQDAPDAEPAVGRPVEPPELPASPGAEAPGAPGGEAQGASGGEAQGASGAEPPEPTRVLDVERPSVSAAPAVAAGRRRRAVLAGAAAGVALLGGAVFLTLPDGSPATGDPGAGRELPSVEGPLGAAIEDLARSVAP